MELPKDENSLIEKIRNKNRLLSKISIKNNHSNNSSYNIPENSKNNINLDKKLSIDKRVITNNYKSNKKTKSLFNNNNKANYEENKFQNEQNELNQDFILNNNSFTESDIDEFKNIFNQNDLKNNEKINKSIDTSNLFEGSEDNNLKNEEIALKDLDPKIKDVLILFVLSNEYYELLVKERAKKAFKFNYKNK